LAFQRATKKDARLRLALQGPPGSGKTYSSLAIAKHLGTKIALIDTEGNSSSIYSSEFQFDSVSLKKFSPAAYIELIDEAERKLYDVLIIDSLSHSWIGDGGALDMVNTETLKAKGNSFQAWSKVTPAFRELIDRIIHADLHIICTIRSKTEWVLDRNEHGKSVPRMVGTTGQIRDGVDYEFQIVGQMDESNNLVITKSRCSEIHGGVFHRPGKEFAETLRNWLSEGSELEQEPPKQTEPVVPTSESNTKTNQPPAEVPTGPLYHSQFLDECEHIAGMTPREDIKRWACDLTKMQSYPDIPEELLRRLMDGGVKLRPEAALASFEAFLERETKAAS
jgi:hypothetical protein